MSTGVLTYVEPKERFKKINLDIILKYEPFVVGIYCKIAAISSGKTLKIDWLVKKMGVSKERLRKAIIFLEEKGFVQRQAMRDEKGHISGWNYIINSEPVREKDRTHIGKSSLSKTQPMENPTYGKPTTLETDRYNNIDNINSTINSPLNKDNIEKTSKDAKKQLSEEEQRFLDGMNKRFPRIMKMDKPLTLEQAKKLKEKFDSDLIYDIMGRMENWKPLIKKNVSAYQTIVKWCQSEHDKL